MKIIVFFTYGTSLLDWSKKGLLDREIKIYQNLIDKYDINVMFVTYGNKEDKYFSSKLKKIKILPVYEFIKKPNNKFFQLFFSFLIPFIFYKRLKDADILKTNQMWGSWAAVISKWLFKKPLIVRCGYELYSFSKNLNKSWFYNLYIKLISNLDTNSADKSSTCFSKI